MTATRETRIVYPSDLLAGRSPTLYRGRIVFTVNLTGGVFELAETTGTHLDICGALAWRPTVGHPSDRGLT